MEVLELDKGDYFVICLITHKKYNFKWILVTVYGDAQLAGKNRLFSENFLKFVIELNSQLFFEGILIL
jgi:hypothetical protein